MTEETKEIVQEDKTEIKTEEEFNLLKFLDLEQYEDQESVAKKIEDKMGIAVQAMRNSLSQWVLEHAEELSLDFVNIAPLGDYEKLIEDNDGMAEFLKTEAHKPEHWLLYGIRVSDVNRALISFVFMNSAVDDGDVLKGLVFTNKTGVIRHCFATVES